MALSIDLDEALGVKVRVALRRRERGVAEKLLDGAEVRAGREEMRRERVPARAFRNTISAFRAAGPKAPLAFSQARSAAAAGWPNGTTRSLRPFPTVRTCRAERSTSSRRSPTSSETRSPVA